MQRKNWNNSIFPKIEEINNRLDFGAERSILLGEIEKAAQNKKLTPKEQTPYFAANHFYDIVKAKLGAKRLNKNLSLAEMGQNLSFATDILLTTREDFPKFGISPIELLHSPLQKVFLKVRGSTRNNQNFKKKSSQRT